MSSQPSNETVVVNEGLSSGALQHSDTVEKDGSNSASPIANDPLPSDLPQNNTAPPVATPLDDLIKTAMAKRRLAIAGDPDEEEDDEAEAEAEEAATNANLHKPAPAPEVTAKSATDTSTTEASTEESVTAASSQESEETTTPNSQLTATANDSQNEPAPADVAPPSATATSTIADGSEETATASAGPNKPAPKPGVTAKPATDTSTAADPKPKVQPSTTADPQSSISVKAADLKSSIPVTNANPTSSISVANNPTPPIPLRKTRPPAPSNAADPKEKDDKKKEDKQKLDLNLKAEESSKDPFISALFMIVLGMAIMASATPLMAKTAVKVVKGVAAKVKSAIKKITSKNTTDSEENEPAENGISLIADSVAKNTAHGNFKDIKETLWQKIEEELDHNKPYKTAQANIKGLKQEIEMEKSNSKNPADLRQNSQTLQKLEDGIEKNEETIRIAQQAELDKIKAALDKSPPADEKTKELFDKFGGFYKQIEESGKKDKKSEEDTSNLTQKTEVTVAEFGNMYDVAGDTQQNSVDNTLTTNFDNQKKQNEQQSLLSLTSQKQNPEQNQEPAQNNNVTSPGNSPKPKM